VTRPAIIMLNSKGGMSTDQDFSFASILKSL
jgi:hypothetical protein